MLQLINLAAILLKLIFNARFKRFFFSLTFSFPCSLRGLETHGLELVDWFSVGRAGFFGAQHTKKFINKYE